MAGSRASVVFQDLSFIDAVIGMNNPSELFLGIGSADSSNASSREGSQLPQSPPMRRGSDELLKELNQMPGAGQKQRSQDGKGSKTEAVAGGQPSNTAANPDNGGHPRHPGVAPAQYLFRPSPSSRG